MFTSDCAEIFIDSGSNKRISKRLIVSGSAIRSSTGIRNVNTINSRRKCRHAWLGQARCKQCFLTELHWKPKILLSIIMDRDYTITILNTTILSPLSLITYSNQRTMFIVRLDSLCTFPSGLLLAPNPFPSPLPPPPPPRRSSRRYKWFYNNSISNPRLQKSSALEASLSNLCWNYCPSRKPVWDYLLTGTLHHCFLYENRRLDMRNDLPQTEKCKKTKPF